MLGKGLVYVLKECIIVLKVVVYVLKECIIVLGVHNCAQGGGICA
jgi:hypothetical protein